MLARCVRLGAPGSRSIRHQISSSARRVRFGAPGGVFTVGAELLSGAIEGYPTLSSGVGTLDIPT